MKRKYLIFAVIISLFTNCKEKLTDEQIINNENKKQIDSLYYLRQNLIHNYSRAGHNAIVDSLELLEIGDSIIYNGYSTLDIDSENLNAIQDVAFYSMEQKDYKNAIIYYSKLIKVKKNTNNVGFVDFDYQTRGKAKFYLKDYVGAVKDFEEFKSITSLENTTIGYTDNCFYLGKCYMKLNDRAKACDNLRIYAENIGTDEAWEFIANYCN